MSDKTKLGTIGRSALILVAGIMLPLLAAAALQGLHPIVARAETSFLFTGQCPFPSRDPSHSKWTISCNWTPEGIPGPNDDVILMPQPPLTPFTQVVTGIPAGTVVHGLTLGPGGTLGGSLFGEPVGDLTVTATFNWTGGILVVPLTVPVGGTVSISGAASKLLATAGLRGTGILNLAGTTTLSGPGALNVGDFAGPAFINNTGIFTAGPGASMNSFACCQNPSQFNNQGQFVVPDGAGTVVISFVSYNPVFNGLQASGRTVVGNGATLELQGAPSTWGDGARFAGPGRTLIDHLANPAIQGSVLLSAGHTLELGTDALGSSASLSGIGLLRGDLGNGTFVWSAGILLGSLHVDTSITTVIRGPAGKILGETGKPGSGFLDLGGPTFLSGAVNFGGPAILNNRGTFITEPGASLQGLACCPRFLNPGNLVNDSGSSTTAINAIELVNGGTISLTSGVLSVNPRATQNGSPAFVEPNGATLQVAIGGTAPGTGFGQLQLSDTAEFAGNLLATNVRGFTPTPGQTFKVITCAQACIGTFQLQSVDYSALYHPQDVTLITRGTADTDLALSGVPANITVNATSPSGAVVTYAVPTAVDEAGESPTVSCSPASGSTFAIGTSTVTCTASDSDDAPSTVSQTFTVTVNDTDLALSGVPANITINATGPSGATVNYVLPTVVEEDASLPTAVCSPASGTSFPIGSTIVNCTVSDADDMNSPVNTSFMVTVKGASAQLVDLLAAVQGVGSGTSLADKVQSAQSSLASGDVVGTCSILSAFIQEVQAQSGKHIPVTQASQLIADAQRIRAVLAC